jgi:glycosyltransferase involved in cell wall biosynthesis
MSEAVAYLSSRYPGVTHTFIVGEVRALRAAGVRVETATVRRVPREELLAADDREEDARTRALVPAGAAAIARAHGRALARSPGAYAATLLRALRAAPAGGKARLWQLFYFAEAILLWEWMEGLGLRHVHVHHANVGADAAMLACAFANRSGARRPWTWSLTLHGPTELLDVSAHNLALKVADAAAVVCISDFARSQVAALLPAAGQDGLHVVRCGIDTERFAARAPCEAGGPKTILCVAALERRKGHRVLLEAFARLRAGGADARLRLVGDGGERASLEARARELGVAGDVEFLGAVAHDRLPALYAAADVFCLPSFAEGVPTVLMEAMAIGVPVVATNIMGVPELVEHERDGLLVPPARADLLAAALARLLADAGLRERFAARGRERVLADYDRARAVPALHAVLAPFIAE